MWEFANPDMVGGGDVLEAVLSKRRHAGGVALR